MGHRNQPIPKSQSTTEATTQTETEIGETQTHTILAKETKYGIARKYGITINELETLNPDVPANFPIGTVLKVPNTSVIASATIEESTFDFYEVQPKEGFYRLEIKLGLTEEEIVGLNPYAKDGLKDGMILKIPKENATALSENTIRVDLENYINDRSKKRLAVLLPFQLKNSTDSISGKIEFIKNNRTTRIALDFYSGVLMAAEFAKDKGLFIELDIYDTEGNINKTNSILTRNDFSTVDAVIGPLLSKNVEKTAALLKRDNIPVFSPLSNRSIKLTSNLFQTLPNNELLETAMERKSYSTIVWWQNWAQSLSRD